MLWAFLFKKEYCVGILNTQSDIHIINDINKHKHSVQCTNACTNKSVYKHTRLSSTYTKVHSPAYRAQSHWIFLRILLHLLIGQCKASHASKCRLPKLLQKARSFVQSHHASIWPANGLNHQQTLKTDNHLNVNAPWNNFIAVEVQCSAWRL